MQFLILGYDGNDEGAQARRQEARPKHLAMGGELLTAGNFWYGAALLDDDKNMIGSSLVMDFPSREELDAYLKVEPYVVGDVWKTVEVRPCSVRNPWQFSRPQEFFDDRTHK